MRRHSETSYKGSAKERKGENNYQRSAETGAMEQGLPDRSYRHGGMKLEM
jgi:hypothetical protein